MIRSELVQRLAARHGSLTRREIERVVAIILDSIVDALADGGRVELRGFGAFSTRARDGRAGRNPRTGDSVEVPAKRVPYFKAGKDMRERLNAIDEALEELEATAASGRESTAGTSAAHRTRRRAAIASRAGARTAGLAPNRG